MSSVMGSVIMAIRTPGLRDFIMKVRSKAPPPKSSKLRALQSRANLPR